MRTIVEAVTGPYLLKKVSSVALNVIDLITFDPSSSGVTEKHSAGLWIRRERGSGWFCVHATAPKPTSIIPEGSFLRRRDDHELLDLEDLDQ